MIVNRSQANKSLVGIDFGLRHVGVAYSENGIVASTITTVAHRETVSFLTTFCKTHPVTSIIIGFPEGRLENATRRFGAKLRNTLGVPVVFWDETLSSQEAQKTLIANGASRKRRQEKEHAVAAALILQSYIDSRF